MDLELWEVGRAELRGGASAELASWLSALYGAPAPTPGLYEAYLHEAPLGPTPAPLPASRRAPSAPAPLVVPPALPAHAAPLAPTRVLLGAPGLALVRT